MTLAVLAGSILGIVLTGFLRRPMVVESKELKYPEGVATAEILKTGMAAFGEGRREGIRQRVVAFFGGFAVKVFSSGVAVLQETVSGAFRLGNSVFRLGSDVSAALVGVGFIIEFNGAVLVALGGALAWLFFIPLFTALQPAAGLAGCCSLGDVGKPGPLYRSRRNDGRRAVVHYPDKAPAGGRDSIGPGGIERDQGVARRIQRVRRNGSEARDDLVFYLGRDPDRGGSLFLQCRVSGRKHRDVCTRFWRFSFLWQFRFISWG